MASSRTWFGSGAVLAGLGAAMLCGAGSASADTEADSGSPTGARNAAASPAAERGARLTRVVQARRPVAAAASALVSAAAATVSLPPAAASAASVTVPTGINRFNRADRPRPKPLISIPAVTTPPPVVTTPAVPSSDPVDPAEFAGTYYEQGSVKQFFSIGLVNTTATYSVNQDGTIRVQNSGNYFFNRGPKSSIVGSAVPVNSTNTALNVGFGGTPSANPPGNYTILAKAPDYSWIIVSDPSGRSGYILTREKTISPEQYQELLTLARSLGVRGNITPTAQYS